MAPNPKYAVQVNRAREEYGRHLCQQKKLAAMAESQMVL